MTLVSFAQAHEQIQVLLQYSFSDTDYLEEALYACPGYVRRTVLLDSNKRLAMVGDSAVDLVVNEMSYREGLSKGESGSRRQKLLCDSQLAKVGEQKGMGKFIRLSGGTVTASQKTIATAVEALLGAVFLDANRDLTSVERAMQALGLLEVVRDATE